MLLAVTQRKEDRKCVCAVGGGRWPWGPMVFLLISLFPKCIKFPEMKVPRTTESPGFQGHRVPQSSHPWRHHHRAQGRP